MAPKRSLAIFKYRLVDTISKVNLLRPTQTFRVVVTFIIARGAADDLNLHRGFLGPKLLISIRSLVEQYSLFEICKQIFEAVV